MKKFMLLLCMFLFFCIPALAADTDTSEVARDYQAVLGGGKAVVELTDQNIMAAVANLKIYPKINAVILPAGLKDYFVIRAGKEQAFLIIPHYKRTRLTVRKAADGKKEGSLKGEMEGRSLLLFCNKGDAVIDMLVRSSYGIQLVNFTPEAEDLQENGQPGEMIIPERKQRFLKDVTAHIRHDGETISAK
ncbi:MAG: hypothetical protein IKZ43_07610 [Acidaminococcaceae bacterium]|nr:hypothetical protein [Acidaminococcaceae bacterium]